MCDHVERPVLQCSCVSRLCTCTLNSELRIVGEGITTPHSNRTEARRVMKSPDSPSRIFDGCLTTLSCGQTHRK
jgi:hypothetical protein